MLPSQNPSIAVFTAKGGFSAWSASVGAPSLPQPQLLYLGERPSSLLAHSGDYRPESAAVRSYVYEKWNRNAFGSATVTAVRFFRRQINVGSAHFQFPQLLLYTSWSQKKTAINPFSPGHLVSQTSTSSFGHPGQVKMEIISSAWVEEHLVTSFRCVVLGSSCPGLLHISLRKLARSFIHIRVHAVFIPTTR
jgi:hypothetical protein